MSKYSEKLRSPKWQKKRLEILSRDNFTCQYCKDAETELQIHHLEYSGEPWQVENDKLITLCKNCHEVESKIGKIIKVEKVLLWKIYRMVDHVFISHNGTITSMFTLDSLVLKKIYELSDLGMEASNG